MVLSMDKWKGKVAVITGASSGIGAAIAEKLVEEGMVVAGLARRVEKTKDLATKLCGKKGTLHAIQCDVTVEADMLKAFKYIKEKLGPIYVLVNNAGIALKTSLTDGSTNDLRRILEVNVLGLCTATREAIKDMRANKVDGHIIHINSIAGHMVPPSLPMNIYPASKYAVTALTESLRLELNTMKSKIKVTSVSPGLVKTEIVESSGMDPAMVATAFGGSEILNPEDIADGIVYALSTPPHVQIAELTIRPMND